MLVRTAHWDIGTQAAAIARSFFTCRADRYPVPSWHSRRATPWTTGWRARWSSLPEPAQGSGWRRRRHSSPKALRWSQVILGRVGWRSSLARQVTGSDYAVNAGSTSFVGPDLATGPGMHTSRQPSTAPVVRPA